MERKLTTNQLKRMPSYLDLLRRLANDGIKYISCQTIADCLSLNKEQVRKDIALVSQDVGVPNKGRKINDLIKDIEIVLGLNNDYCAVLIGVGSLGTALLNYGGFTNYGLKIIAAFDNKVELIDKEVNGIKYAFLSYTTYTNGLIVPTGKEYLVNVYDEDLIKEEITRYRDKVDLLMVAMHWGTEYMTYPTNEQKEISEYLASLGVDLIIGCHPHVIEPIEYIDDTLVIYSLGNFISSQIGVERLTGLMLSLNIKKEEYHGKTTISFEDIEGTLIYTDRNNGYIVYPYDMLTDNILNNYETYYEKYKKVVTAYSDQVTVKSLEG